MEVKELYRGELDEYVRKGAVLIDVREDEDRADAVALPGDRHVPLSRLGEITAELPAGRPVIFYCRSGLMSYRAAEIVATWTKTPVYYLAGGLLEMADA